MGPFLTAAIPAAISAASAFVGSRMNRKANEALSEKQFTQNKEMWNLQNQYNTPSAQVSRLKAAGLNPALAYGGSGSVVGNADTTPQLDYSGAMNSSAYNLDLGPSIAQGLTASQIKSQIEVNSANASKSQAETYKTLIESRWITPQMKAQLGLTLAQTDKTVQETANDALRFQSLMLDNKGKEIDNKHAQLALDLLQDTYSAQVEAYSLQNELKRKEIAHVENELAKFPDELANLRALTQSYLFSAKLALANNNLAIVNTDNAKKQYDQIVATINKLSAETDLTEKQIQFYVSSPLGRIGADVTRGLYEKDMFHMKHPGGGIR